MAMLSTKLNSGVSPPIGSPGGTVLSGSKDIKLKYRAKIKICTWNVKTMAKAGKIQNAIQEMKRMNIGIMGVSEMRWPNSGEMKVEDHTVFYSGTDGSHEHGVGVIISPNIAHCITNFVPISDRAMLLQVSASPVNINILQVYAPTADKPEDQVVGFYHSINTIIEKIPKHELLMVMGDFNARLGAGIRSLHVGEHGLGERNERGDLLETFAESNDLVVMNTFFRLPPRRLYTWKSPQDKPGRIVRNQIDYLLVNRRFRNSCTSVKTYPGADIESDHVPLVGVFKVRMKRVRKKTPKVYNMRLLKEPETKRKVEMKLNTQINDIGDQLETERTIEKIQKAVEGVKEEYLRVVKTDRRKPWMTNEIMAMMEERRKHKKDPEKYRMIKIAIRNKIREAKDREAVEKCEEIETLQKKYDSYNLHRKVKELTGNFKNKQAGILTDSEGRIIVDKHNKINTWKEYLEKLFEDHRMDYPDTKESLSGPEILQEEVQIAIAHLKEGKAAGPDNIQTELLKLFDKRTVKLITQVFNNIYNTGKIPSEWLKSEFVAIPKKARAKKCEDYRTISLMSHLLKVFLKVIHKRIYNLCESQISPNQFGFVKAVGTREALFAVQVLFQRCRDVNCDVYACLIDYQKAFDRVKHEMMVNILKETGIDDKDLRIIGNLYWNQVANLRVEGEHTDYVKIKRGVRQGCILSPLIFNLYSERIFSEALDGLEKGILINGHRMNNIRYADDTIVFADSLEDLQVLVDNITHRSNQYGLDVNVNKTKLMIISKKKITGARLFINQAAIERVEHYNYLGTIIDEEWSNAPEIKSRIGKARSTFNRMSALFKSHNLTLETKVRLLRCYVFSVLLYGAESWTLNETTTKKLNAFEMWLYRRILKIPWTAKISNIEVLRTMKKDLELMNIIKARKLEYLGHIMRNEERYGILQTILQGKILGRRGPGRRRISWLKNLRTWFNITSTQLFRIAADKVRIAMMIANIRNGSAL